MIELSAKSCIEEFDIAMGSSQFEFGGDALSKNLLLPPKAIVFDDLSNDVDDAFWLMMYSALVPVTLSSPEDHGPLLFNFFLKIRSSKAFNIGDAKVNEILKDADASKKYILSELLNYKIRLSAKRKMFTKSETFLVWKKDWEVKLDKKLVEYSSHELPYQVFCIKVLSGEVWKVFVLYYTPTYSQGYTAKISYSLRN
jgi:hypothetical protein